MVVDEAIVGSRSVGCLGLVVVVVVVKGVELDLGCFLCVGSMDVFGGSRAAKLRRWVVWCAMVVVGKSFKRKWSRVCVFRLTLLGGERERGVGLRVVEMGEVGFNGWGFVW